MLETQNRSMKSLPGERRERCPNRRRETAGARRETGRVNRVADHGMTDMRHMHAYLVRTTGFELQLDERRKRLATVTAIGLDDLIVRHGLPARIAVHNSHPRAIANTAPQGRIHGSGGAQQAPPDKRLVPALEFAIASMRRKLRAQSLMSGIRLGHDQETAGILVQPVHDTGPPDTADAG